MIFIVTSLAWFILGRTLIERTKAGYENLNPQVQNLWGEPQVQLAPVVTENNVPIDLSSSHINTNLRLEYRRRGLLWFAGYSAVFNGVYQIVNSGKEPRNYLIAFTYPSKEASYDEFTFAVNGEQHWQSTPDGAQMTVAMAPGSTATFTLHYKTRGMGSWSYTFGSGVQHVHDFQLETKTNFLDYDFPLDAISPTSREGHQLFWRFSSLLSSVKIGIIVPEKQNPGDIASRIAYFAPVGLFFFFTVILVWCLIRGVNLHSMHFAFLAAGFFAFHLLFAYLIDHMNVTMALLIAGAVSLLLIGNYMRLVAGMKFTLLPTLPAQLIFLVLFSYAFLFKGYTGLAITIGAVLTLGVLMQVTAQVDLERIFPAKTTELQRTVPESTESTQ